MKDPRLDVFLSSLAPEIFHSVSHRHEMWREDPFDVPTLHPEARDVFARMLVQATTPPGLPSGRILVIRGESGSGKTHLLRAFRTSAHADGSGYVGYMQMSTATHNYGRYMLANLIDSLDQPYVELLSPSSALSRLAHAVASRCPAALAARLADPELPPDDVHAVVHECADVVVDRAGLDLDLVRALLYLNRDDPRIKSRVLKYLRCEPYSDLDRAVIGGIPPRTDEDDPMRMIEHLGQLVWQLGQSSLVLCLDQLEDIWELDESKLRFRRAMSAVCTLADRVPSSIIVIACLEDFYARLVDELTRSMRDRLEEDPAPVRLIAERAPHEVRELVARRLSVLYDKAETPSPDGDTYPFPEAFLGELRRLRTRSVLDECRHYRERAIARGALPDVTRPGLVPTTSPTTTAPQDVLMQQAWNDFRSAWSQPRPETDEALGELLAGALEAAGEELESGHTFTAVAGRDGIAVDSWHGSRLVERLLVKICNRSPRGGGLVKQLADLRAAAAGRIPVIVRSTEFPSDPRTQIAQEIGKLITGGGRRTVIEDSAWLTMMALREFRMRNLRDPGFAPWLASENVLSQMPPFRTILGLDRFGPADLPATPRAAATSMSPIAPPPAPRPAAPPLGDEIVVGRLEGLEPRDVTLPLADVRRHAAFLGMSGSGKTTLVMNVVEDLLLRGVPVILVDRKGDLCGYARRSAWERPLADPALEERRRALRQKIDVQVFTPGSNGGRPLAVPLVPDGIGALPAADRDDEAALAAQAIGGMLDYKHTGRDKSCRAVLIQAVRLLARSTPRVTIEALIDTIGDEDAALVGEIGRLDTKLFKKVATDLETFKITAAKLLQPGAEELDIDALFGRGRGAAPNKTRLSIISTKFLGDNSMTLFWVAQLLLLSYRWANKHPSPETLQGAILLDEADLYLPATSQPATKQPMENLLRRARSAGLAVLLATQNPGDLDYKCRDNILTWFVGKITQAVSLNKMRPMLSECRVDIAPKLASRRAGQFFFLRNGDAIPILGRLPAIMPEQLGEDDILSLATSASR